MLPALLIILAGGTEPPQLSVSDVGRDLATVAEAGFSARYFTVSDPVWDLSGIDFGAMPAATGVVDRLARASGNGAFWQGGPSDRFAAQYSATLTVARAGSYTFHLTSDDGSALLIGGARLIDNDGVHPETERSATVDLEAGAHPIEVRYFENEGEQMLTLDWSGPDTDGARQVLGGATITVAKPVLSAESVSGPGPSAEPVSEPVPSAEPVSGPVPSAALDADVLYIGHSLIGIDIPAMLQDLTAQAGGSVHYQIINGAPLKWNWDNSATAQGVDARAVLPNGDIDVLVITEALPLVDHATWSETGDYAFRFYDLAVEANPAAQVYLYETWHSLDSGTGVDVPHDENDDVPWRERLTQDRALWDDIVASVNARRDAGDPAMRLLPVGQAMGRLQDEIERGRVPGLDDITQLFEDDIHTNLVGDYFVAMVHYAGIYGKSPEGLPHQLANEWGVAFDPPSAELALALQRIAWEVAGEYREASAGGDPGGVLPPANAPPTARDDVAEVAAGQAVTIDVLDNDADPDGDLPELADVGAPSNGSVELVGDEVRYTPAAGFAGYDSFTYSVADGQGGTGTGTVDVSVIPEAGETALGLLDPALAMGLSGIADWSVQQPFIDVMKSARPWIGHRPGQWGGMEEEELRAGGHLDENGWVTSIPETVTGLSSVVLTDLPASASSLAGRYRLTYEGEGKLELSGRAQNTRYGDGEIWFSFTPGEGSVFLDIAETDPNATGNYIRNISIVKEEQLQLYEAGAIFNPDWIGRISDLRAVRFMDWMDTNDSDMSAWRDRPEVSDYSYMPNGVPVEIMVALANEIGADPWFTMPHQATDEYMRNFAEYVRDNLDPQLKAYVEYSNEVWNWQFNQAHWAYERSLDRWGVDGDGAWMQFVGMRAAEMAQIWDEAFGAEADARLTKVLSTQTGWLGLEAPLLGAPLWVAEDPANRPPAEYFDAYGITGYFSAGLGHDEKVPAVKEWIAESRLAAEAAATAQGLSGSDRAAYVEAHRFDAAVTRAAAELRSGSETGSTDDSLDHLLGEVLPYQASVAAEWGLDLIMYEGGTHVVGIGPWVDDEELTGFFTHLNYTPEMGRLYETLLDGWKASGGTLFNAFVDTGSPSKWGSWGALRTLSDDNPRWDALTTFNESTPAWWELRPADAFDHGAIFDGTPGDDILEGTVEEDILLGLGGDDLLIGNGKSDRLHGGPGEDTALLPNRRSDFRFEREDDNILIAHGPDGDIRLVDIEIVLFADEPGARLSTRDYF